MKRKKTTHDIPQVCSAVGIIAIGITLDMPFPTLFGFRVMEKINKICTVRVRQMAQLHMFLNKK